MNDHKENKTAAQAGIEDFNGIFQGKRSTEHLSHFCHSSGISGKNVWYLGRGLWLLCYDCVLDFDV